MSSHFHSQSLSRCALFYADTNANCENIFYHNGRMMSLCLLTVSGTIDWKLSPGSFTVEHGIQIFVAWLARLPTDKVRISTNIIMPLTIERCGHLC